LVKRRQDIPREPSGRPSRRKANRQAFLNQSKREAMRTAVTARMRHHNLSWHQALSPYIGFQVGRMFVKGLLTPDQFDAANKWAQLAEAHKKAHGLKSQRSCLDIGPRGKTSDGGGSVSVFDKIRLADYRRTLQAARSATPNAQRALQRVIEEDKAAGTLLEDLYLALDAISKLWRGKQWVDKPNE